MTRKGKEAAGEHKVNGCICSMPVQNQVASRDLSAVVIKAGCALNPGHSLLVWHRHTLSSATRQTRDTPYAAKLKMAAILSKASQFEAIYF